MEEFLQQEHFRRRSRGQNYTNDSMKAQTKTRPEMGYNDSMESLGYMSAIGRKDMNNKTRSSSKRLSFLSE
jgi:hypothetical protein